VELRHLEYFVAVAEELSFTRASRRLHVVQSGVSSAIQGLERELGVALFDRDRHRVILTEAGHALLPEARATLAAAQTAAEAVAEAAAGLRGTLTIGSMLSTGRVDMPALLGWFHQQHPAVLVRLRVFSGGSAELAREVVSGSLDLALLSIPGEAPAGLTVRPLASEPLTLICDPRHPLAGSDDVTLNSLASEPFIDFPVGWGTRAVVDRAFAAAGVDRQVSFEVGDYATTAGLVRHGLGVAFIPASAAATLDDVARLSLSPAPLTWRILVATPSGRRLSAAARAFVGQLVARARLSLPEIARCVNHHHRCEMPRLPNLFRADMTTITQQLRRPQPREGLRERRHNAAFWIVGYVFAVTIAFSALPTPLYVLYQARDGFSTFMITVIFAAYAVGVVGSLFLAGHLSDWVGRRRMIVAAIATNMLSGVLFLAWPATAGLIVARVISGVSIGMLTATATAYLSELHAAARPGTGHTRSEIISTAANLGGIGLGPLLSGLLAQYVGHALVIPFLVSEALMLAGAIALAFAPETTARPERRPAYRPQRVSVPAAHRSAFLSAAILGGALFALFGIFTSVAPSVIAGLLHNPSHAVAGVVSFAVFGASAGAQILFTRASRRFQVGTGAAAVVAGLAMVTAAVWIPSFWLLLAGGIVAGAGAGAAFRGAVATVISITPAEVRGEALAGLFLGSYVGLAVPVVGLGVATLWVSMQVAVLGFAAVLVAVTLLAAPRLAR
jgi:DNA-binding transcriptional LysR family regulator/MFS family permease